ncbi:MAG: MqnA/MqnD/SBP family protein, partial [Gemmataceae bacterium]
TLMRQISTDIKKSIRYGLEHREEALVHALKYGRGMDPALADKFVGMYVNDWTLDYGDRGRVAIRRLLEEGHKIGLLPAPVQAEFVE